MERRIGSICLLVLLIHGLISGCFSAGSFRALIDGYTNKSTFTSGEFVPLGTPIILVCRVVGPPYGTPLSYTWTCPNGPCEVEGYYGRQVYNEHILAVNTTSTSDGGTYTCQVTATGRQEATGNFTLRVKTGGHVVHSYGRLIPHEFPITGLQQISGPDGIGRITCTVRSGTARFVANGGSVEGEGVSETRNGTTATLEVTPSSSFRNRGLYCGEIGINFFHLFISSTNPLSVPSLMVDGVTSSAVEYQVQRNDNITNPLNTGYEVIRFGVPMIGHYVNAGRGSRVTISPAVPGAQYRITAWAVLGEGRRSATPAVVYATTGEARPTAPRMLSIAKILKAEIELNWLPPTEPNGEVHYVIYYTLEGGTEQSIDTRSKLTHYNLTGLERNRVYTNISVQAVNSVGRSERSNLMAQYNHIPPDTPVTSSPTLTGSPGTNTVTPDSSFTAPPGPSGTAALIAGVVVAFVAVILLTLVGGMVMVVVVRRKRKENDQSHSKAYLEDSLHGGKGTADDINMYKNVHTPASGHSDPYYSTADKFANPASATASFGAHMYDSADYSEADQRALDIYEGGLYEDASAELTWGGGGYNEKPVKVASGAQKISAVLTKAGYELMNPEELYTQPDKSAKVKKNVQGSKKDEENAAPVEDLYTVPDMTKKRKQRNQQQCEEKKDEGSLPPQTPLPYKQHKEAKHESEEDGGDPELPPPYVPDEEQYCNTRGGAGPSSSERNGAED